MTEEEFLSFNGRKGIVYSIGDANYDDEVIRCRIIVTIAVAKYYEEDFDDNEVEKFSMFILSDDEELDGYRIYCDMIEDNDLIDKFTYSWRLIEYNDVDDVEKREFKINNYTYDLKIQLF